MTTPKDIIAADALAATHPATKLSCGIYRWQLQIGDRNFIRFDAPLVTRDRRGKERPVWCRIDNNKRFRTTKPTPAVFFMTLRSAMGKPPMPNRLVEILTARHA